MRAQRKIWMSRIIALHEEGQTRSGRKWLKGYLKDFTDAEIWEELFRLANTK